MKKRGLYLLLSIILIFAMSACSDKRETGQGSAGQEEELIFQKTIIQKPEDAVHVESVVYLEDGTLRISTSDIDYQNNKVWDSSDDGMTWTQSQAADKSLTPSEMAGGYHYSSEGKLYVYDSGSVSLSAGSDPRIIKVGSETEMCQGAVMAGDVIVELLFDVESNRYRLEKYNIQTTESMVLENEQLQQCLNPSVGCGGIALNPTGEIVYVAGAGIGKYDIEQGKFSFVIDNDTLCGVVDNEKELITGLAVNKDENKVVICAVNPEENQHCLYLCKWEEGSKAKEQTGQFRIYSLKENSTIRQAASFFQGRYPDVAVTYEVGYTGEDGITVSDAVRTLNTELMAGKGPDILILDGLPAEQYIEKGILEDVTDIVRAEEDNLFENIIYACNEGGQVYKVPTAFVVPLLLGNEDITSAENTEQLIELLEAQSAAGIPAVTQENFSAVAGSLFLTSEILKEYIDPKELTEFYQNINRIAELSFSEAERREFEDYNTMSYWVAGYPLVAFNPELNLYFDEVQTGVVMLSNCEAYLRVNSVCKAKNFVYQYLNRENGCYFIPTAMLGVSSASGYKEMAEQFLQYYISSEGQMANQFAKYNGISVNREVIEQNMPVSENGDFISWTSKKGDDAARVDIYELTPAELQDFINFLEKLDTPVQDDAVVLELVMEQADAYIFEGIDLQNAVEDVCGKANLYLSE